jgi:Gpi18-like mannosyltransferase
MRLNFIDLAFLICVLVISFFARLVLFPIESGDYIGFLEPWMREIRANGGVLSLGKEISNYSPAYMIVMSLFSYLPGEPLYPLKAFSLFFDYVAAFAVALLIYVLTDNPRRAIAGMAALLMTPTVVLNSAAWGQCDMIYAAFVVLGLCYYFHGDYKRAMWLTAVAFAFKLQALFILPFYVIMYLCPYEIAGRASPSPTDQPSAARRGGACPSRIKPLYLLVLPLPFLLAALPGIIMGRGIASALGVYFGQAGYYPWLTLNYPNIYAFFGQTFLSSPQITELAHCGLLLTLLILGFLAYFLYQKKPLMNADLAITTALFSLCLILFGLPYMHERYGMLIDVLAVVYAILRPAKIPLAIGLLTSSLLSYSLYLFGFQSLPPLQHALLQLVLIVFVGRDLYSQVIQAPKSNPLASAEKTDTHNYSDTPK